MANNNSYFGGILAGLKTLVTGMDITMGEYVTPKITVVPFGTLPRSEKKTKRVIDHREM